MRAPRRVVLTRAPEDNRRTLEILGDLDAEVIEYPCIAIEPVPIDPQVAERFRAGGYEAAVFVSRSGVEHFFGQVGAGRAPRHLLAIGNGTAQALASHGWDATALPSDARAEIAAEELDSLLPGKGAVLHVRGVIGGTLIQEALRTRGRHVDEAVVYRTVDPIRAALPEDLRPTLTVFASPSAVRHFVTHNPSTRGEALAIGRTTQDAAVREGFATRTAQTSDLADLARAIHGWVG